VHCVTCRFENFFIEPLTHTILNGVGRPFLALILDQDNPILVDGRPFCIPIKVQREMDAAIKSLQRHGAFGRHFALFTECASCSVDALLHLRVCAVVGAPTGAAAYFERCRTCFQALRCCPGPVD
jgi:hypothetical protein